MEKELEKSLDSFGSVWERVTAVYEQDAVEPEADLTLAPDEKSGEPEPMILRDGNRNAFTRTGLDGVICSFISAEHAAAAMLRALASKSCASSGRGMLLAISADNLRHAKALQLEYFLRTGDSCIPNAVDTECAGLLAGLRRLYLMTEQSVTEYMSAAEQYPEMANIFLSIAEDKREHAQKLRNAISMAI